MILTKSGRAKTEKFKYTGHKGNFFLLSKVVSLAETLCKKKILKNSFFEVLTKSGGTKPENSKINRA